MKVPSSAPGRPGSTWRSCSRSRCRPTKSRSSSATRPTRRSAGAWCSRGDARRAARRRPRVPHCDHRHFARSADRRHPLSRPACCASRGHAFSAIARKRLLESPFAVAGARARRRPRLRRRARRPCPPPPTSWSQPTARTASPGAATSTSFGTTRSSPRAASTSGSAPTTSSSTPDGLTTVLPDGKQLLQNASFKLEPSSLTAVIGPSGAGKSTLLGALTGLRPATHGRVIWQGHDLYAHYDQLRFQIGLVPQQDIQHPQLKVRQALRFAAQLRLPPDTTRQEQDARVQTGRRPAPADARASTTGSAPSSPAARRSGSRSPPSCSPPRRCSSSTSPPPASTRASTSRSCGSSARSPTTAGSSWSSPTRCSRSTSATTSWCWRPGGRIAYFGPPAGVLAHFGCRNYPEVFDLLDEPDLWHRIPVPARSVDTSQLAAVAARGACPAAPVVRQAAHHSDPPQHRGRDGRPAAARDAGAAAAGPRWAEPAGAGGARALARRAPPGGPSRSAATLPAMQRLPVPADRANGLQPGGGAPAADRADRRRLPDGDGDDHPRAGGRAADLPP